MCIVRPCCLTPVCLFAAATPILVRGPAVDYTFAPLTPRQSTSPPQAPSPAKSGEGEEVVGTLLTLASEATHSVNVSSSSLQLHIRS